MAKRKRSPKREPKREKKDILVPEPGGGDRPKEQRPDQPEGQPPDTHPWDSPPPEDENKLLPAQKGTEPHEHHQDLEGTFAPDKNREGDGDG